MVPEQIALDLLSFDIPVIVLGDLNQLPPVMGRPVFLQQPDAILNQIMRQNEESPIIRLSQDILHGNSFGTGNYDENGLIKIVADKYGLVADFKEYDAVIVGKNITRDMYNKYIREQVYHRTGSLRVGDKIICRKNNWSYCNHDGMPLTNGLVGYVVDIDEERSTRAYTLIEFKPEGFSNSFNDIYLDRMAFETPVSNNKKFTGFNNFDKFEYAYAITCHLAQGSQYNNVYIKYERMGTRDYCKRWLYTAVTRAVERITLVI
jgi:exodeoxyribonuclease-5